MISRDTSRESEHLLTELYRAMPPAKKIALVFSACRTGQKIALAGLKNRFPNDTPQQIWHRWARQHLGEDLYQKAYGTANE